MGFVFLNNGAPEGIRTPNLLIRSFARRLSERISKVLGLRSFAHFKRRSAPKGSQGFSLYLNG